MAYARGLAKQASDRRPSKQAHARAKKMALVRAIPTPTSFTFLSDLRCTFLVNHINSQRCMRGAGGTSSL